MTAKVIVRRIFLGSAVLVSVAVAFAGDSAKTATPVPIVASWTLRTDDTKLTIGVGKDQQMYLVDLSNPAAGWNWATAPSP